MWLRILCVTLLVGAGGCPGDATSRLDGGGDGRVTLMDGPGPGAEGTLPADWGPAQEGGPPSPDLKPDEGSPSQVVPPLGGSSGGQGGGPAPSGQVVSSGGVSFVLIVPSSYQSSSPNPLMVVYSGTEGASVMAQNLLSVGAYLGLQELIFAVLDGKTYYGDGQAGATALDHVRASYNIDNDRTYLLSESAGTSAGLQLGLALRQSYFSAYWANDVNASATPQKSAAQLGFAPWGNAGPGGQLAAATVIVNGMKAAGYRLPADAPYSGAGSTVHGSPQQFMAALSFFKGKARQ